MSETVSAESGIFRAPGRISKRVEAFAVKYFDGNTVRAPIGVRDQNYFTTLRFDLDAGEVRSNDALQWTLAGRMHRCLWLRDGRRARSSVRRR